ncbi:Trm5-related predicted tRNA methylase [Tunturiibacter psychrotolerans]
MKSQSFEKPNQPKDAIDMATWHEYHERFWSNLLLQLKVRLETLRPSCDK